MRPAPFSFAIQTGPFDDPAATETYARLVESLGYDDLYSYDHIGGVFGDVNVDPFLPLIVAARATTRIRVGPLVLNNEFHHPVLLARQAITAALMSDGRLVLGMGTGYAQAEHDAIGVILRPPGERVTRLGESLTVLSALLASGTCTHDGVHHHVDVDGLGVRMPSERVPILVGGHGRRVVELAARHADIFQFTGLTHGPDGTPSGGGFAMDDLLRRADWLSVAAADRDDEIVRSALVQFTHVGPDAPTADALAARFHLDSSIVSETPFALFGSQDEIIDKIEHTRETLGISHFVVRDPDGFAPIVDALRGR